MASGSENRSPDDRISHLAFLALGNAPSFIQRQIINFIDTLRYRILQTG